MIIYKVEDNQENKEETGFLRGVLNSLTSFFTPSDERIARTEVKTAIELYNLIYLDSRSLDYFNLHPFFVLTIPVLKRKLKFDDKYLATIIEFAIIISNLSAKSLKSCIDAFLSDESYDEYESSVLEDFFVLYFKYINSNWFVYFDHEYETDVFKHVVSKKIPKLRVPIHDYAYKLPVMYLARLNNIAPLIIDVLPIYMRNEEDVSYEKICSILTEIIEGNPFDFLAKNVEDLDAFCFGVAYLKFSTDLPISDEY